MKIGCSLYGWQDLTIYRNEETFFNFTKKIIISTCLDYYELPFLPNLFLSQEFFKMVSNRVYSIHASKHVFEKSINQIKDYFKALYDFCQKIGCKYVVVHPPEILNSEKIAIAISCMEDIYISIENVSLYSLDVFSHYEKYCKMTIDLAHLVYLKQFDILLRIPSTNISHFHVRGYSPKIQYVQFANNRSVSISKILVECIKKYECPFILEYPYENYSQLQKDIFKLKERGEE